MGGGIHLLLIAAGVGMGGGTPVAAVYAPPCTALVLYTGPSTTLSLYTGPSTTLVLEDC